MTSDETSGRLHVDRTACVAHGLCGTGCPRRRLDEWGYPVLVLTYGAIEDAAAERAAKECPVRALLVLRDSAAKEGKNRVTSGEGSEACSARVAGSAHIDAA